MLFCSHRSKWQIDSEIDWPRNPHNGAQLVKTNLKKEIKENETKYKWENYNNKWVKVLGYF